jgi:ATP adenylyltransferase
VRERRRVDVAAYRRHVRSTACFVCAIARGEAELPNPVVYEDELAIAWVSSFQTHLGYTLVAPREHREHVTGDFAADEYVALQRVVHRVGEAVRRAVPTERLYVLSLGSREGNAHVHWHLVPPAGRSVRRAAARGARLGAPRRARPGRRGARGPGGLDPPRARLTKSRSPPMGARGPLAETVREKS